MLFADGVSLAYKSADSETFALQGISLTINDGEFVVLRGPSGSGKSSLLYILSGLRPATAGTIRFGDQQYGQKKADELTRLRRKHFGFIFQYHFLINYLNALENVLVTAPEQSAAYQRKAVELLESLGLGAYQKRLPHQLSGGQRQRVAIARALLHDPRIIFADEPTASLNTEVGLTVMELLAAHREERVVIMVTHDEAMARFATRTVELRDGLIVADSLGSAASARLA